jgi:hypothetical protein
VTIGLYDTELDMPAGPVVDPGPFSRIWTNGRSAMVLEEGDVESRSDNELRTFDLVTGQRVDPTIVADFDWNIVDVVFADDEFYTAILDQGTGGRDRLFIQRRDLQTGDVLAETTTLSYQRLSFRSGVLVAATNDGTIVELDPVTLDTVGAPFPGVNGAISVLALDADARRLMVRADDDSLRFFDVATRTQLGDPIDTDLMGAGAAFRSDGLAAAAATRQGIVSWDLDPQRWVEAACNLTFRNMTQAEWDRYIGDLAEYRETCPQHSAGE